MRDDHHRRGAPGLEIELDAPEALVGDGEPDVVGIVHQGKRVKLDGMVDRFIAWVHHGSVIRPVSDGRGNRSRTHDR